MEFEAIESKSGGKIIIYTKHNGESSYRDPKFFSDLYCYYI